MKINETISGHPLNKSLDKIVKHTIYCSAPVLVVKEDDLKIQNGIISYFRSKRNVYYIQLGIACSMYYIAHDISRYLSNGHNRVVSSGRYPPYKFIRDRIKNLSESPLIVIDNCHHFVFEQMFHLIGLINMLDGLANFIFLVSDSYIDEWRQNKQSQLYYFNKIINKVFRLEL